MKTLLKVLVALFALGLSASAAYFSVLGLTKMFAGAVVGTAIVCSFIEGSKLIIASVLHQFGKQINLFIKSLLILFLLLSMAITSMGVYGYLTNAFQSTANQLEVIDGQTKVIQLKRERFQESLDAFSLEKKDLTNSITELAKGLANNTTTYKDRETGQILTRSSSSNRKALEKQLDESKVQRGLLTVKIEALTDSVTKLDFQVLDLNTNNDLAAEVGPLKFISNLTGVEMNRIVNLLTLVLVLIIDPLAIVLVIVFNKISKTEKTFVATVPTGKKFNVPYPLPEISDTTEPIEEPAEKDLKTDVNTHYSEQTTATPKLIDSGSAEAKFYGENKRTKRFG